MLQEKYLPSFHYSARHSIVVHATPEKVFPSVLAPDFSRSWIIRLLYSLRGIPATTVSLKGLPTGKFIPLEVLQNEEIIIGVIGRFWKPSGELLSFEPKEFIALNPKGVAKASWNFRLIPDGNDTRVETETRIFCTDEKCRRKFSRYWFIVRPFSGLIRREMLNAIKRTAEGN
jgi:hypothetical protein